MNEAKSGTLGAIPCPTNVSPRACQWADEAYTTIHDGGSLNLPPPAAPLVLPAPAPTLPQDAILTTFQQWWAAQKGVPLPQDPPAPAPPDPTIWAQWVPTLVRTLQYWGTIGRTNPTAFAAIPSTCWNFPVQFLGQNAATYGEAVVSAILHMVADPNAKASLVAGKLPATDITSIDWTTIAGNPLGQNWPAIATQLGVKLPDLQTWVARAASCGLFQKTQAEIQAAVTRFTTGGLWDPNNQGDERDPCFVASSRPPLPTPGPTPAPGGGDPSKPPAINPNTPPPTDWTPIVLGIGGVTILGVLAYAAYKRGAPAAPAKITRRLR